MNSIRQRLEQDVPRLMGALGLDGREARLEARILLGRALHRERSWLIAHEDDVLEPDAMPAYEGLLSRRLAGEPIAYILGEKEFYGRIFRVTPGVLIPRPETELLVELALERCRPLQSPQVLDLGTGSGCIAISLALECPRVRVTAGDASGAALEVARENAKLLSAEVEFLAGEWFAALGGRRFDIIVANPPYVAAGDPHLGQGDVRHEPKGALVADNQGLADIEAIVDGARRHLGPAGVLLLEHGYNQAPQVRKILQGAGFGNVATFRDLAGSERVTGAEMSEFFTTAVCS